MVSIYLGLFILSAAALAFEVTLTRLFSVTQWYHFAFLAVSVALLGYGASGTALTLVPRWARPPRARRASTLSLLFSAAVVVAYLALNHLPFDSYRIAWERMQILYLALYYLALSLPFFCAGMVTGLLLAGDPGRAARIYAANLLGSAAGGLIPILLLAWVGEGLILAIAAAGLLAALVFRAREVHDVRERSEQRHRWRSVLILFFCMLFLVLAWRPPALFQLKLSPYKGLSQVLRFPDAAVVVQKWNAFSRLDRVSSVSIRSAPGLSLSYAGALPPQDGLFVDGDDLSPLVEEGNLGEFTNYMPTALPYQLRPGGRALLLGARGGLDLHIALEQGAGSVVAVEYNPLLVQAAAGAYAREGVVVRLESPRSFVNRTGESFDIVHLALSDGYRPVTSGAFSLGERYDLTVESLEAAQERIEPGGMLLIERWLQLPPSEMLRAGATAIEALRRSGVEAPAAQLVVLRDWQVGLILVKNGVFTPGELDAIRAFSRRQGLDLVALPGMNIDEANRSNILHEPVYYEAFQQLLTEPETLYAEHPYNVRPPTDDQPFFFHYFKWGQARAVLDQLGQSWQPWGGSGYFVLFALLGVAAVASLGLILLPLALAGRRGLHLEGPRARVFVYFGLLGLGFLFVEIPLMQRFILFLDQPIYAITTVLAAMLFFSGLGSLASVWLSPRLTLPALTVVILLYPPGLHALFGALLGAALPIRLLVAFLTVAPLGFLMGIPFPGGVKWLRTRAPGLVPWAWAINGCASVLASVLAAIVAISAGFSWVLAAGAFAYGLAWLAFIYGAKTAPLAT